MNTPEIFRQFAQANRTLARHHRHWLAITPIDWFTFICLLLARILLIAAIVEFPYLTFRLFVAMVAAP